MLLTNDQVQQVMDNKKLSTLNREHVLQEHAESCIVYARSVWDYYQKNKTKIHDPHNGVWRRLTVGHKLLCVTCHRQRPVGMPGFYFPDGYWVCYGCGVTGANSYEACPEHPQAGRVSRQLGTCKRCPQEAVEHCMDCFKQGKITGGLCAKCLPPTGGSGTIGLWCARCAPAKTGRRMGRFTIWDPWLWRTGNANTQVSTQDCGKCPRGGV